MSTDQESASVEAAAAESAALLRRHVVATRVSEAEYAELVAAAGGRQMGRWARAQLLAGAGGQSPDPVGRRSPAPVGRSLDQQLVAEVRRVGVNLNQIARRLNGGRAVDQAAAADIAEARAAMWAVYVLLDGEPQ